MSHGNTTHGYYGTPTYNSWAAMVQRCRVAGVGYDGPLVMVGEWLQFEQFLADMGERPEGTTLDREDGTKGYSPSNCRWATPAEQSRNRKSCRYYTHAGKKQTIAEWARELGISKTTLHRKLVYRGMSFEEAISG